MSKLYLGNNAASLESSPHFDGYTKVVITVDEDGNAYEAGSGDTVFEVYCPWGTQAMANAILADVQGFSYRPYEATGAILDPAAELGDAVTVGGVYGGIYDQKIDFTPIMASKIAAPQDKAIDNEYPFVTAVERATNRKFADVQATLAIQSAEINAKVSQTGGDSSSFGWTLTADGFVLSSNNTDVFIANEDGVEINGKVTATSGYIGGTNGFHIKSGAIYSGDSTYSGSNGIYIGTDGIRLGSNFKVDAAGNLSANTGKFAGNVSAGSILHGGNDGTFSGSGLTASSVGTGQTSGGINTSLGYANFSNGVFAGINTAANGKFTYLTVNGTQYSLQSRSVLNAAGQAITINYLGY